MTTNEPNYRVIKSYRGYTLENRISDGTMEKAIRDGSKAKVVRYIDMVVGDSSMIEITNSARTVSEFTTGAAFDEADL